MSTEEKSNEWDSLWQEYTKSLDNWKTLFEKVQIQITTHSKINVPTPQKKVYC